VEGGRWEKKNGVGLRGKGEGNVQECYKCPTLEIGSGTDKEETEEREIGRKKAGSVNK